MEKEELPMHKDTYFFGYGIDIEKPDEMARQIIKLKEENKKLKEAFKNVSEFINEYRKHQNIFKWNEQDYIDVIDEVDNLLKECIKWT